MSERPSLFPVTYGRSGFRVDAFCAEHFFFFGEDKELAYNGAHARSGGDLRDMHPSEPKQAEWAVRVWLREARKRNPNF